MLGEELLESRDGSFRRHRAIFPLEPKRDQRERGMFRETVTRGLSPRRGNRSEAGTDQKDVFHASRAASIAPSIMPLDFSEDRSLKAHRQIMFSKLNLPLHSTAGIERNRVNANALPQLPSAAPNCAALGKRSDVLTALVLIGAAKVWEQESRSVEFGMATIREECANERASDRLRLVREWPRHPVLPLG